MHKNPQSTDKDVILRSVGILINYLYDDIK